MHSSFAEKGNWWVHFPTQAKVNEIFITWSYFIVGATTGFMLFARRQDFKDLGLSISETQVWEIVIFLPWIPKIIWGIISDTIGCCGFHRKPYLVVSYGVAMALCFVFAAYLPEKDHYLTMFFFLQFSLCWGDIIVDALMIAEMRGESPSEKGSFLAYTVMARTSGYMVGGLVSGIVFDVAGPRTVYLVGGCIFVVHFVVILVTYKEHGPHTLSRGADGRWDISSGKAVSVELDEDGGQEETKTDPLEPKVISPSLWRISFNAIIRTLGHPVYKRLLLFNLVTCMLPSSGLGFYYYLMSELKFTATQFSLIGTFSYVVRIVLVGIYNRYLRQKKISTVYFIVQILDVIVSFMPLGVVTGIYKLLGVSAYLFVLSDDVLDEALDLLRGLPLQITAGILCERNAEAAVYQISHSLVNAGWLLRGGIQYEILSSLGIDHGDFSSLGSMIVICGVLEMTIPFILSTCLLPRVTIERVSLERERELRGL